MIHKKEVSREFPFDRQLLFAVLTLTGMGMVMVTSASLSYSESLGLPAWSFALKHAISLGIGLVACFIAMMIPINAWRLINIPLLVLTIGLLALLLIPGVSREVNGSTRWLFIGPLSLQVSELAKLFMIIYMAGYLVRKDKEVRTQLSGFLRPISILGLVSALLILEPDFGATVVIVVTILGMLFIGGVPFRIFLGLFLLALMALGILLVTSPYRLLRLTSFLDPWSDQFNSGYQLTQSLIAFGRGGLLGTGLGNSVQKLLYLPESHTDFIYAVIAEELGLFGALGVLLLFALMVWRILVLGKVAIQAGQKFSGYIAYGIGLWIGLQSMINIGVNVGVLPTKGLTLPFMSYGGSSLIIGLFAVGVIFRIEYELKMNFSPKHHSKS